MSLKRIAEMTGTSISTVSRVLNHTSETCASKELKDRIWEAARTTGYRPNEAARSLKKGVLLSHEKQPDTEGLHISIILARIDSLEKDPFFYELFRCLEQELFAKRITIDELLYADNAVDERLKDSDGVILLGRCTSKLYEMAASYNENLVGIWRNPMDFSVDEVVCDGQKAAETAMEELLSLGHKSIAYIGNCSYESRYVGYCDMLIKNHLHIDTSIIRDTDQTFEEAVLSAERLLDDMKEGKADFTSIFCANDITAIGVLSVLKKEKKSIRDSISVISIDNIEKSQETSPMLTTIDIPRVEMAHLAVELLSDRIKRGHTEPVRIEFPCRIIRRGSCHKVM